MATKKKPIRPGTIIFRVRKIAGQDRAGVVKDLAAHLKCSPRHASHILDGKKPWTPELIRKLERFSDIDRAVLEATYAAFWAHQLVHAKPPVERRTSHSAIKNPLHRLFDWSQEKRTTKKRSGGCCEACGAKGPLEVHHINGIDWGKVFAVVYEQILCSAQNLKAICKECHAAEHKK